MTPQVVVLRGTAGNPFELRPWELLHNDGRAEVRLVVGPDNLYDVSGPDLPVRRVPTVGAKMPPGLPGRVALKAVGQRHLGLAEALQGADVVHAAELGYWFSAQAAREKLSAGFKLALTVWETLPFGNAYRNARTRRYRRELLEATDLFLPVTERARAACYSRGYRPSGLGCAYQASTADASPRHRPPRRQGGTGCSRWGGWSGRRGTRICSGRWLSCG